MKTTVNIVQWWDAPYMPTGMMETEVEEFSSRCFINTGKDMVDTVRGVAPMLALRTAVCIRTRREA